MKRLFVVGCAALLIPAAAFAQATPASAPQGATAAAAPAPATPAKQKKVCKSEEETGSRLSRKTTCRTQAEWDDISYRQRMDVERKSRMAPSSPSN